MSFTIRKMLTPKVTYEEVNITLDGEPKEVDITYKVNRISAFDGNMVTAEFIVSMNGIPSQQTMQRMFAYSGEGNPLDQAEDQLKAWVVTLPGVVLEDGSVIPPEPVEAAPELEGE